MTTETLSVGSTLLLRLPGLGGSGYVWRLEAVDPPDAATVTFEYESSEPQRDKPVAGESAPEIVTITAERAGPVVVHLTQVRPWAPSVPIDTRVVRLSVVNDASQ
jgi:hypothetical protein